MLHPRSERPAAAIAAGCAAAALLASGCALQSPRGALPPTPDGLVYVATSGSGSLFVRPGLSFDGYDDIYIAQIGISYADGQQPLSGAEENRVYQRLVEGRVGELTARGQRVADKPGPCTLAQSVYLTDLKFFESKVTGSQSNVISSFGAVTIVSEFRDSTSNEILVRYGERRSLGSGVAEGRVKADLARLDQTLDGILHDMGSALRRTLPLGGTDSRASFGCEGRIGKVRAAQLQRR